jgi:hypothetical protein
VEICEIEQSRVRNRYDQQKVAGTENIEVLMQYQIAAEITGVGLIDFICK